MLFPPRVASMSASCSAAASKLQCLPSSHGVRRAPFLPILNARRSSANTVSSASLSNENWKHGVIGNVRQTNICCSTASAACITSPDASPASANPLQPTIALIAAVTLFLRTIARTVAQTRRAVASAFPQMADVKAEDVRRQLKKLSSDLRLLAFVAPFAKAAASESLTAVYTRTFERAAFGFAKMYLFCLFMRVLLSWFSSIDWNAQPWTFLRLITEPYLQIYRGILPPLFGQLDFTPLFGFLILQDVVEVMAPTYTMGMHAGDTSTRWTTSDVMCYFDGF